MRVKIKKGKEKIQETGPGFRTGKEKHQKTIALQLVISTSMNYELQTNN